MSDDLKKINESLRLENEQLKGEINGLHFGIIRLAVGILSLVFGAIAFWQLSESLCNKQGFGNSHAAVISVLAIVWGGLLLAALFFPVKKDDTWS